MSNDRTTTVEIRTDLLEALRELHPGRSDREIVEAVVREYLQRREAQPRPRLSGPRAPDAQWPSSPSHIGTPFDTVTA